MDRQVSQDPNQDASQGSRPHGGNRLGLAKRLRNYLLAGILVTAPVSITFWLAWKVIDFIDDWVTPFLPVRWHPETYLPFSIPGLGLLIAMLFFTVVGFLAAGYAGRVVTRLADRMMTRVPFVRGVYAWTKQVFETVLSSKAGAFDEVVLVEYPMRGVWAIGFVTGVTEGEVQDLTAETVYNVFLPATPNPTTGFLLFIPKRDIQHLDFTVEEGIKLVISGGIVTPTKRTPEEAVAYAARKAKRGDGHGDGKLSIMRKLRNYFFAGILVTAPVSITVWLAWEFVSFVDDFVTPLIPRAWNPETYLPFSIPGLGVLLVIAGLTVIGFFAAGLVGRTLVRLGERLLDRMPVIRRVYGAVKQLVQTVLQEKSKAFREVVLIEYPRKESWALGFITGETEHHVQGETSRTVVNVFLPTTPNPTSGFLLFVPQDEVQMLTMTVEEGIKMVVSGGIVTPPSRARVKSTAEMAEPAEAAAGAGR